MQTICCDTTVFLADLIHSLLRNMGLGSRTYICMLTIEWCNNKHTWLDITARYNSITLSYLPVGTKSFYLIGEWAFQEAVLKNESESSQLKLWKSLIHVAVLSCCLEKTEALLCPCMTSQVQITKTKLALEYYEQTNYSSCK